MHHFAVKMHFHRLRGVAAPHLFSLLPFCRAFFFPSRRAWRVNGQVNARARVRCELCHRRGARSSPVSSSREIEMHITENSDIMFRVTGRWCPIAGAAV